MSKQKWHVHLHHHVNIINNSIIDYVWWFNGIILLVRNFCLTTVTFFSYTYNIYNGTHGYECIWEWALDIWRKFIKIWVHCTMNVMKDLRNVPFNCINGVFQVYELKIHVDWTKYDVFENLELMTSYWFSACLSLTFLST